MPKACKVAAKTVSTPPVSVATSPPRMPTRGAKPAASPLGTATKGTGDNSGERAGKNNRQNHPRGACGQQRAKSLAEKRKRKAHQPTNQSDDFTATPELHRQSHGRRCAHKQEETTMTRMVVCLGVSPRNYQARARRGTILTCIFGMTL